MKVTTALFEMGARWLTDDLDDIDILNPNPTEEPESLSVPSSSAIENTPRTCERLRILPNQGKITLPTTLPRILSIYRDSFHTSAESMSPDGFR